MNTPNAPYLPNPDQHILLKAALLEGEPAIQAWQSWHKTIHLDDIDYPSLRMLPMLYHNLRRNNTPEDPALKRLKGVYRLSWVQNHLLFRQATEVISRLNEHSIEVILLKGTAMVFGYYHDYGIRPMHDLDLLVKAEHMESVGTLLNDLNWKQQHQYSKALESYRRELVFENDAEQEIDVHWHLLREWCFPEHDTEMWKNTHTIEMNQLPVTVLNPTFNLLHLCGHGYQWSDLPSLLWIADIHKIITTTPDQVNWDKLLSVTSRYNLTIPLSNLFQYLANDLNTPIPSTVLDHMNQCQPSRTERAMHDARAGNPKILRRVIRKHWFYYVAIQHGMGKSGNVFPFIYYLCLHFQDVWKLKRWWYAPFHAIKMICRNHQVR